MKIYHYRSVGMILLLAVAAGAGGWKVAFSQTKSDDPVARSLYQRALNAERTVNVSARVSTTHWGRIQEKPWVFDLLEGNDSRYRMVYRAPATVAGRVVIYDGKTLHQYEPSRNLVMRRALASPPAPTKDSAQYVQKSIFSRSKEKATVAGRPVTVVNRHYVGTGFLRERRWIDNETYRTLQREQFDDKGHITRRIRYETVSFAPKAPNSAFVPRFPTTARILLASQEKTESAPQIAKQVSLPTRAAGFTLQSAVLVPNPAEQQLLFSDGIRSISVFVSIDPVAGNALKPGSGWQTVATDKNLLIHTDKKTERTAVAWIYQGRRYVAIGRMPIDALLAVVRVMQPTASSSRT